MVNVKKIFKRFGAIAMSSVMAVSLTACGGSDSGASAGSGAADGDALPKEIRIGYWATPNAELLVKETGALEELYPDVEVTWTEFTSGADILTAMQAGSIDFSTIGTPPGTTGIANDYPFSVYYLEDIIGEMEGLIVKEDSGINSLADLKGKTIATSFSTTSHFSLLNALDQAGVNPSDVTIMDMDASNIYAAWERGDIDGAYIWESVKSQILNSGGKQIISSAEVAEKSAATCEFITHLYSSLSAPCCTQRQQGDSVRRKTTFSQENGKQEKCMGNMTGKGTKNTEKTVEKCPYSELIQSFSGFNIANKTTFSHNISVTDTEIRTGLLQTML